MAQNTLTVTDNRTGRSYELPIADGAIRASDLRQIKTNPDDFGLLSYDPAYMNTASCRSTITYIDGDKGILLYRGYPIDQRYRPFCSERCRLQDLARWASGHYRVSGDPAPETEDAGNSEDHG